MATEIIKLIEEFAVKNGQLDKMNAQLGQKKDGPELRAKLSAARDSCKAMSKRIAQLMKESAPREDKRVIAKLKTQFESELEKFRGITKTLEVREREILVAMSVDSSGNGQRSPLAGAAADSDLQLQSSTQFAQAELDRIREKQEAIMQIESDVTQLNEMFHDLNFLVQEQQVGIDVIENNISQAKQQTSEASVQLVEANEYQKSSRTCMCYIAAIILAIAIAVTIYFTSFYNKDKK